MGEAKNRQKFGVPHGYAPSPRTPRGSGFSAVCRKCGQRAPKETMLQVRGVHGVECIDGDACERAMSRAHG